MTYENSSQFRSSAEESLDAMEIGSRNMELEQKPPFSNVRSNEEDGDERTKSQSSSPSILVSSASELSKQETMASPDIKSLTSFSALVNVDIATSYCFASMHLTASLFNCDGCNMLERILNERRKRFVIFCSTTERSQFCWLALRPEFLAPGCPLNVCQLPVLLAERFLVQCEERGMVECSFFK